MKAIAVLLAGLLSTTAQAGVIDFAGQILSATGNAFESGDFFSGVLTYGDTFSVYGPVGHRTYFTSYDYTITINTKAGDPTFRNSVGQLQYFEDQFSPRGLVTFVPGDSISGSAILGFTDKGFVMPSSATINNDYLTNVVVPVSLSAMPVFGPNDIRYSIGAGFMIFGVTSVPEPASWALMIGGIGLAGGMMRRQRARTVTFA